MLKKTFFLFSLISLAICVVASAQHAHHPTASSLPIINGVEPQPLLAQAIRLKEAMSFLGSSLSKEDEKRLEQLSNGLLTPATVEAIQHILDPYCLAMININPEARVKVARGPAAATLMQNGWTSFLVKVHNEAGVTAALKAESPAAAPALHISTFQPRAIQKHLLSEGQVASRFLEIQMYQNRPLLPALSGLLLEYAVVQVYSKDAGKREAEIGFNIGQGSQDIGFRNTLPVLFDIRTSVKVVLHVKDEDGSPVMASFVITDGIERIINDSVKGTSKVPVDYRFTTAQSEYWQSSLPSAGYRVPQRLTGIYPLPSRRVAAYDTYPDFFFQPQIYRSNGEHVLLPPGKYRVRFTRGPEYLLQTKELIVPGGVSSIEVSYQLKRWVNMAKLGWYSADHHLHAAGCSHYESPEEGVKPVDMWRQVIGEDLHIASVLSWGPGWYHQKQFFTGGISPLTTQKNIMRYDVEVSGFPSSHAGHLVLLQMKEDDYPGTKSIEDWPAWTMPVLQWAKKQEAITGYAHSGWGLQPVNEKVLPLPNYELPKMDGIGANEYIVTVTENLVDFYSAGDTPAPWELNMWYHTLNCGFRPRLSGETDFPCIYDERVGVARTYFKTGRKLNYDDYIAALKNGRSYVSEGSAHIIDFSVNGLEAGTKDSELKIEKEGTLKIFAKVAALLPEHQDEEGAIIAQRPLDRQPYWNIERSRIGKGRKIRVELVVNGIAVDTTEVTADGTWNNVNFQYLLKQSSWVALRVFPSAHTNPVFVLVDNSPIRVQKSAEWCRQVVDQCWKMKQNSIRAEERSAAAAVYNA
ncbi:MAG TPA: CehA/McbA family metallohydrolase, partial [Flavisolibacter sp.]|nr:CehA/McbA family metallohydrolase [Flavisolibacter sp.]